MCFAGAVVGLEWTFIEMAAFFIEAISKVIPQKSKQMRFGIFEEF